MDDHSQTFFDAVDIAKDGTIWLSDATTCFAYHDSLYNFIEESATGRLLSYTPATGKLEVHLEALFFANGVALGPDDNFF